jgi:hypothetical protein
MFGIGTSCSGDIGYKPRPQKPAQLSMVFLLFRSLSNQILAYHAVIRRYVILTIGSLFK